MTTARPRPVPGREHPSAAWERRRNAAWIDYLRISQESDKREYDQVELNAWEQLQRRLRRNDELRDAALTGAVTTPAG